MILITWDDLSGFTWDEIHEMGLTWDDMETLKPDQLLDLAKVRVRRFQTLPQDTPIPAAWQSQIDTLSAQVQALTEETSRLSKPHTFRDLTMGVFASLLAAAALDPGRYVDALAKLLAFLSGILPQR